MNSSKVETRFGVLLTLLVLGLITAIVILPTQFRSEAGVQKIEEAPVPADEPIYDIREDKAQFEILAGFRQSIGKTASSVADSRDRFILGEEAIKSRLPHVKIEYNNDIRIPEVITPDVMQNEISFLSAPSSRKRSEILRDFLKQNNQLIGINTDQADSLKVAADYTNPDGNISYAHLEQEIDGVPVFRGEVKAGFTKNGQIIRVINNLAPGLEYSSLSRDFHNPADAVAAASARLGRKVAANETSPNAKASTDLKVVFGSGDWATTAEKMYFPTEPGVAIPAWRVLLTNGVAPHYVIVDAASGVTLWSKNLQNEQTQSATYQIYGNPNAFIDVADSPAPMSPGPTNPTLGTQAPVIARTNRTLIGNEGALSFNNNGWITDGTNITDGNFTEAGVDRDTTNGPDATIIGAPNRIFDSTWNPAPGNPSPGDDPLTPQAQRGAVIQMFYVMNRWHDALYQRGFTEAARNFQHLNFGRGGVENDRVSSEGQDSTVGSSCPSLPCVNNANFFTPADGSRPRMQMYIWNGPTPDYDGTADAEIIIHEVSHGLSNRLHGNAAGLGSMGGMMGEGWGDWYANTLLAEPTDPIDGIYGTGGWATYLATGGYTSNYYTGIRRFPRAILSAVGPNGKPHSPLSFRHINSNCNTEIGTPTAIGTISAYPRGPFGVSTCNSVHNGGEIWSVALWEVRAKMVTRLGFNPGTIQVLQVVTDGMKLSPISPTFLQGRDAIIAAAAALPTGASNAVADVREGFRIRGMGFSASVQSTSAVTEAFDFPNVSAVDPFSVTETVGDGDGSPEPGETVGLSIAVRNPSTGAPITNVSVSVNGGSPVDYGTIADGATVTNVVPYVIPAGAPCGSMHQVSIVVSSSVGSQPAVTKQFRLGVPVGGANATFTGGAIANPAAGTTTGVASPYPGTINVTGLTGQKVIKLQLNDLNTTYPGDMDWLLVGPGGQKFVFMSDAVASFAAQSGATLTIHDGAANAMPATGATVNLNGEWKPTNHTAGDAFAAPAPGGPYQEAAPAGTATFASVFGTDGAAMNGTWSLYGVDDISGDVSTIGGWSLIFEADEYTCSTTIIHASVSGRVVDAAGRSISRAVVTLTNGGNSIHATTNTFGYFYFPSTTVGTAYNLTVGSKRHTFAPQTLTPTGNVTGLVITANP